MRNKHNIKKNICMNWKMRKTDLYPVNFENLNMIFIFLHVYESLNTINTGMYLSIWNFIFDINFSVGVFLFSFLCVLGSSTFAAGIFLKGTSYMLPIMLLGRLLFGSGNGSLTSKKNPSWVRFITEIIDFNKAQIFGWKDIIRDDICNSLLEILVF